MAVPPDALTSLCRMLSPVGEPRRLALDEASLAKAMQAQAKAEGHRGRIPRDPPSNYSTPCEVYERIQRAMPRDWSMTRDLNKITGYRSSRTCHVLGEMERKGMVESRRIRNGHMKEWRPV